jgi:hypothetical protein
MAAKTLGRQEGAFWPPARGIESTGERRGVCELGAKRNVSCTVLDVDNLYLEIAEMVGAIT